MKRSTAPFGLRMWRRCAFAFVLSYKKVTRGSELPGARPRASPGAPHPLGELPGLLAEVASGWGRSDPRIEPDALERRLHDYTDTLFRMLSTAFARPVRYPRVRPCPGGLASAQLA